MVFETEKSIHPTIRKCLQHLDVIKADDKTKQIVYMYMETLLRDMEVSLTQQDDNFQVHSQ